MANSDNTPEEENEPQNNEEETSQGKVEEGSQPEGTGQTALPSGPSEGKEDIKSLKKELEETKKELKEVGEKYSGSSVEGKRLSQEVKELREKIEAAEEEGEEGEYKEPEEDYSKKTPQEILNEVEKRATTKALEEVEKRERQKAEDKKRAKELIDSASEKYPLLKASKSYKRMVADVMDGAGIPIEEACERVNGFMEKVNKEKEKEGKKEPFVEGATGSASTAQRETREQAIKKGLKNPQITSELKGLY
jgi:uncharacterized phage infection (PIP) family protein YhgE